MNCKKGLLIRLAASLTCCMMAGCSASRYIPEGEYLLDKASVSTDTPELKAAGLDGYLRQQPNSKWFSIYRVPMHIYCLSGRDSTKRFNRFLRKMGEAPVLYDEELAQMSRNSMEMAVRNMGYLNARVDLQARKRKNRLSLKYVIEPGNRYYVRNLSYDIQDTAISSMLFGEQYKVELKEGMPFNLNVLDSERGRINAFLQNKGYFKFNTDYIRYEADTTVTGNRVDLRMILKPYKKTQNGILGQHPTFRIGKIEYEYQGQDSLRPFIRKRLVENATMIQQDSLYSDKSVQDTYSRLARMSALMNANIHLQESREDSSKLDANIALIPNKRHSFKAEVEGTNSAGDLGAALSLSYQNRNIFRGSETFGIKLRGAFEAIKGLSGYQDQNYMEYSAETSLLFPDFVFPFLKGSFRRKVQATSELSIAFDLQDRPEFHRRVLTGTWRYKWSRMSRQIQQKFDLLDLNYVFMPWISPTFADRYLNDPENRNAILRYNYENLFIMKWGYYFSYTSEPLNAATSNYGTNAFTLRGGIESSGNLLYAISRMGKSHHNDMGQYTLFGIAYAQYVKGDFDFSKSFRINKSNSLALHFGLGIAFPYGNSTILPYEKRYFSGGANSVRGWSVRGLGPGSFRGTDGRIDFINQTGDIKLDMNLEYRTHLFWKLDGALFVDAGNIWTLREYEDQPGGQFRLDTFLRQIAASYGLGVRLNFDYFIIRLDGGMKAINPAYSDGRHHYPIIHPDFGRDFTFHFAVGLPF